MHSELVQTSKMKLSEKKKKKKKKKKTVTSLSLLTIFPQTLHPRCLDGFKYTPETAVKEYDVT